MTTELLSPLDVWLVNQPRIKWHWGRFYDRDTTGIAVYWGRVEPPYEGGTCCYSRAFRIEYDRRAVSRTWYSLRTIIRVTRR